MLQQKKNSNLCATSLDFVGSLDFILVSEAVDPSTLKSCHVNFWQFFAIFGNFHQHFASFGYLCQLLAIFVNFWPQLKAFFDNFWQSTATFGNCYHVTMPLCHQAFSGNALLGAQGIIEEVKREPMNPVPALFWITSGRKHKIQMIFGRKKTK